MWNNKSYFYIKEQDMDILNNIKHISLVIFIIIDLLPTINLNIIKTANTIQNTNVQI